LRNWVIDNHVESLLLPKAISSAKFVIVTAASKQAADFRTLLLFFGFSIYPITKIRNYPMPWLGEICVSSGETKNLT
jgi:hypothetical protein